MVSLCEYETKKRVEESRIKKDLHPMKTMICVWWDCEGSIHWEMLEKNMTVEKNLYKASCQ